MITLSEELREAVKNSKHNLVRLVDQKQMQNMLYYLQKHTRRCK